MRFHVQISAETILPNCPNFDGQSYLVHVVGGRWQISNGISRGAQKLLQNHDHPKKRQVHE